MGQGVRGSLVGSRRMNLFFLDQVGLRCLLRRELKQVSLTEIKFISECPVVLSIYGRIDGRLLIFSGFNYNPRMIHGPV